MIKIYKRIIGNKFDFIYEIYNYLKNIEQFQNKKEFHNKEVDFYVEYYYEEDGDVGENRALLFQSHTYEEFIKNIYLKQFEEMSHLFDDGFPYDAHIWIIKTISVFEKSKEEKTIFKRVCNFWIEEKINFV